ncbi:MAG: PatB family C-S lyase [Treponema sp.]|nr:PatB family C-S lyase [Treponema sp.]
MQYNFDEVIDRNNNHSAKYDERVKKFGKADVLPLWVADMDFRVAQPIIDTLLEKARHGFFGYTSRPDSYFDAVCQWKKKRDGWTIDRSLIAFCPGIVPALSSIVHQFSDTGNKVLIQTPVYPEFDDVIRAWGRVTLISPLTENNGYYTVDFDNFEKALQERPKLFILCSPHNPVGRVWKKEELLKMCELCLRYDVRIISDEIHSDLILWGNKHIPTATLSGEIAANTITCVSATKTFNLAGLQASAVMFPNKQDMDKFTRFWRNLDMMRNNAFSIVAMEAAFRHGEEWLEQLIPYLEGNINFVHDYCAKHIPAVKPNVPESTYLIWLNCKALGMDDKALMRFMIDEAGLGLNTGASFGKGGEGYMRLNIACPRSVLQKAMQQLKDAEDRR